MSTELKFPAGTIVRTRGREWVVQPESQSDLLMLKPLGGNHFEITGILPELESVESAEFRLPDLEDLGDFRSSRLLREAVRLGFRNSSGPFRSFARLSVEPRPYQLVPLLMALRLDPVRLLIADDVGIGKTVEAGLIARELLDRGEVSRLAVLCPPHLAEQWQEELAEKFNLKAELVLASTVNRLERQCRANQSIFERFPYVVVSIDYIKSDRRRDEFVRTCPEFVIVDEAHTCAGGEQRSSRHQRFEVVRKLAKKPNQHMILVTATPHSGKEDTFRSLLTLLNAEFANLPENLAGEENRRYRDRLARYLVQRRRADIRSYMSTDTPFPERLEREETYELSSPYRQLLDDILAYARERVKAPGQSKHHQRIRWWSALALLRSVASSPAAAVVTLKTRSATIDSSDISEADYLGRQTVMDLDIEDAAEQQDVAPGAEDSLESDSPERKRLLALAAQAEALKGDGDIKLQKALKIVKKLLDDGHQPILFCRFIPTAEYVGEHLRKKLGSKVQVEVVTGTLPPSERQERVEAMEESPKRVLVCTDCLSEGVNLQQYFDTVIHYDLSWNPTRHEQREGRVDRYGQPQEQVRVITYYCKDNEIDPIVIKVLLRKHQTIRRSLGISVPVPVEAGVVLDSLFEALIIEKEQKMEWLPGLKEQLDSELYDNLDQNLLQKWDNATEREKASRSLFAQHSIRTDEVQEELKAMQAVLGSGQQVKDFVLDALEAFGGTVNENSRHSYALNFKETPRPLQDRLSLNQDKSVQVRFELPLKEHETLLHRTSPLVEQLAGYVLDTALDTQLKSPAARAAVIRTQDVKTTTTLLLVRFRFHLLIKRQNQNDTLLAEECRLMAFEGSAQSPVWLSQERAEALLQATPSANIPVQQAQDLLKKITQHFAPIQTALDEQAQTIKDDLLLSHRRVRQESKTVTAYDVQARTPVDVLGLYIYARG